jgi:hypothetical protein
MKYEKATLFLLILVMSCGSDPSAPEDIPVPLQVAGIRYLAETTVEANGQIRTDLTMTNMGTATDSIQLGGCPLRRRGYASPERSGTPVWDELNTRPPCPLGARKLVIQPGESRKESWYAERFHIQSGTTHRGVFYITTIVEPASRDSIVLRSGSIFLP